MDSSDSVMFKFMMNSSQRHPQQAYTGDFINTTNLQSTRCALYILFRRIQLYNLMLYVDATPRHNRNENKNEDRPDELNPDELNPDELNPDEQNPDEEHQDGES